MSLIDEILERRTVRKYKPDPIPKPLLEKILEAGRQAPSARNRQPLHFVVVTDKELKRRLSTEGGSEDFLEDAAAVIVGCGDPKSSPKWYVVDVAIALENIVLAAWAVGVGSCWIGNFDENPVKQILGIPKDLVVVALLSLGYPEGPIGTKQKKPFDEVVHFNKF